MTNYCNPLVRRLVEQEHQPPDAWEIRTLQLSTRKQKDDCLSDRLEQLKNSQLQKRDQHWLTVVPLNDLDYKLDKKEFRDAIKLRYDWEITDTPMICACGVQFGVDHAMVGTLNHGANKVPDARVDIHARGFWERQISAFFDFRMCHPNADSYRDLTSKQICKKH